jgi:hypothetical protein
MEPKATTGPQDITVFYVGFPQAAVIGIVTAFEL